MSHLGTELVRNASAIVDDWYALWKESPHPHAELSEAELRASLELQLEIIGQELAKGQLAESAQTIWNHPDRLDPEVRVEQEIPIEEMVQAYRILVEAVQGYISRVDIVASSSDYFYFYAAIFELVAESVRRYQTSRAERIAEERAAYLASLTHQMRTPLTSLKGYVELLEMQKKLGRDDSARLSSSISRLALLVNGVLRMERFKPEELPVKKTAIRAADVVESVASEFELEAIRKRLQLETKTDRTLWLETDPDLLWDALSNLTQNAVKYTATGFVRLETEADGDEVLFRVSDSGQGISLELQSKLFKVHAPSERGGMGLGLSIVDRAVTALGGRTEVESPTLPSGGTVFTIRLTR